MPAARLTTCRPITMWLIGWMMNERDDTVLMLIVCSMSSTCIGRSLCHTYRDPPYAADPNQHPSDKVVSGGFANRQKRSMAECASIPAHNIARVKAGASLPSAGKDCSTYMPHMSMQGLAKGLLLNDGPT